MIKLCMWKVCMVKQEHSIYFNGFGEMQPGFLLSLLYNYKRNGMDNFGQIYNLVFYFSFIYDILYFNPLRSRKLPITRIRQRTKWNTCGLLEATSWNLSSRWGGVTYVFFCFLFVFFFCCCVRGGIVNDWGGLEPALNFPPATLNRGTW